MDALAPASVVGGRLVVKMKPDPKLLIMSTVLEVLAM